MIFSKVIGGNIKAKRKLNGFNIQQVADSLGIAYSTMANIESGSKKPTVEQLEKLGELFSCFVTEFVKVDNFENLTLKLSKEERNKFFNDIGEYHNLIEEKIKERNIEFENCIKRAIQLKSKGYSPTGKEFTQKDFSEIQCLVEQIISIRLEQLTNSK